MSSIGAGDGFAAGFLYALHGGVPLAECLQWATEQLPLWSVVSAARKPCCIERSCDILDGLEGTTEVLQLSYRHSWSQNESA